MKQYFCHLEYFATGEGLVRAMAFVFAEDVDSAVKKFLELRVCRDTIGQERHDNAVKYFAIGTDTFDLENDGNWVEVRRLLSHYLSSDMAAAMETQAKDKVLEMDFYAYANYS